MLERFTRFFTGYVTFEIRGDHTRFINIASKSGLILWGFQKDGEGFRASIKAGQYRCLHPIKQRTGVSLRRVKKGGAPFYWWRLRRRVGILAGILLFILIFAYLSGGVWGVEIRGNDSLTDQQIRTAARSLGIHEGARCKDIDPPLAALKLSRSLGKLSWVSVNTDGCTITIEVKERAEKPKLEKEAPPSNMVAARAGKIVSIEAESGMQQVRIGDMVQAGTLLISGSYSEMEIPYVEKPIPAKWYLVPARGSVRGETAREFSVTVPREKTIRVDTEQKTYVYLRFFDIKIPLSVRSAPEGRFHREMTEEALEILAQDLPVGILRERDQFYREETVRLSEADWKAEARYQLRQLQNSEMPPETEILEENLFYDLDGELCTLTSRCRTVEEIGEIQEISLDLAN